MGRRIKGEDITLYRALIVHVTGGERTKERKGEIKRGSRREKKERVFRRL